MMFATTHKHLKTIVMVATRSLDDKGWVIVGGFGLRLLRVVFLLSLWRTLLPESGEVSGMTRNAVLTYTLIAEVFAGQISVRTGLDGALWRGDIANRFLRPVGIYGQFIAEMLGSGLPNLILFSLPLFCLASFLGVNPLPESAAAGVLFCGSLILGIAIGAAFDFIFASFMVVLEQQCLCFDADSRCGQFRRRTNADTHAGSIKQPSKRLFTTWKHTAHRSMMLLRIYMSIGMRKGGGVNQRI